MAKIVWPIIFVGIFIAGCQESMTNEQVITAVHVCEAAGMKAQLVRQTQFSDAGVIVRVECVPND